MSSVNNTNRFEQTKREVRTMDFQYTLMYPLEEEQQWLKKFDKGEGSTVTITFCKTISQVDQVVDVMRSNVNKVLERDVKLGELDARAENLEAASNSFATSAKRVRKKMWWENLKMKLIIGGVLLAILIIIITIIAVKVRGVTPIMSLNEPSVPPYVGLLCSSQ